jgi:hypothetical protein
MNPMMVKLGFDFACNRHEIVVSVRRDMYGCDDLGLGQLPNMQFVH